jgi:hypothetical protein
MSKINDHFREWDKKNLIDDLIILFPKLQNNIIIISSSGCLIYGNVLISNIINNYYAKWHEEYQSWFIPITFSDPVKGTMNNYMDINNLIYSNFSFNEIYIIKSTLTNGITRDIQNVSPIFHSINRDIRIYNNNLLIKEKSDNTNVNPERYINIPPLTI